MLIPKYHAFSNLFLTCFLSLGFRLKFLDVPVDILPLGLHFQVLPLPLPAASLGAEVGNAYGDLLRTDADPKGTTQHTFLLNTVTDCFLLTEEPYFLVLDQERAMLFHPRLELGYALLKGSSPQGSPAAPCF